MSLTAQLRRGLLVGALTLSAAVYAVPSSAAVDPVDIEDEVMCIVCERPLATSAGKAAEDERELIAGLIAQGKTKQQVKDALVAEYGDGILVKNSSVLAGAAPWLAALVGAASITLLLRRRRAVGDGDPRAAAATAAGPDPLTGPTDALTDADDARIDAELSERD